MTSLKNNIYCFSFETRYIIENGYTNPFILMRMNSIVNLGKEVDIDLFLSLVRTDRSIAILTTPRILHVFFMQLLLVFLPSNRLWYNNSLLKCMVKIFYNFLFIYSYSSVSVWIQKWETGNTYQKIELNLFHRLLWFFLKNQIILFFLEKKCLKCYIYNYNLNPDFFHVTIIS